MKNIYPIFAFIALSINSYCQTWDWAKKYGDQYGDVGTSIAIDKADNVYVSGVNWFASGSGSGQTPYWNEFLYKFDNAGNFLWRKAIPSLHAITTSDKEGNCYVYGDPMYGNGIIGKYDSDGNEIWIKNLEPRPITSVAAFTGGDLIVTGYNNSGDNKTLGNILVPNNYGFIAKADKDLNWQWVQIESQFSFNAVVISSDNRIYTAGSCYGCADSSSVRIYDVSGNCLKKYAKANRDINLIAVDYADNFYIGGNLNKWSPVVVNGNSITSNYSESSYIMKFDSSGTFQWKKQINQEVNLVSIQCDKNNKVYLGGNISHTLQLDSVLLDQHWGELFIAKLNEAGKLLWVKNSHPQGASVSSLILDSQNNLICTGSVGGSVSFDNITVQANGNGWTDLLLAKISQQPAVIIPEAAASPANDLIIYPNPNGGNFTIYYQSNRSTSITILIRNELGQTILNKVYQDKTTLSEHFDMSHLSRGIYFIQVNTNQATEVKKIIIE